MRLGKNYQLSEFQRSSTAISQGIDNTIPSYAVNNLRILVTKLLQPINDATGWINVITSGYRSTRLNKAVGGSSTSQHLQGQAADNNFYEINPNGSLGRKLSPHEVGNKVVDLGLVFDQMILYPNFVHLSYQTDQRKKNRNQILYSATYVGPRLLKTK